MSNEIVFKNGVMQFGSEFRNIKEDVVKDEYGRYDFQSDTKDVEKKEFNESKVNLEDSKVVDYKKE